MYRKTFLGLGIFLILFTTGVEALGPWGKRIYLATYPRSGNHWARYLIEEATRVATSSVYCDPEPPHLQEIFPWGGYCAPHGCAGNCRYPVEWEPVVIKTHYPALIVKPGDCKNCIHSIRIVRHPVDSFYSWYAYKCRRQKKPMAQKIPHEMVVKMVDQWRNFQLYWDNQPNVMTVRYEDMLKNPQAILIDMLELIGYPYTEEDLTRALEMHPPQGEELKHLDHFTHEDLKMIRRDLPGLMRKYNYTIPSI